MPGLTPKEFVTYSGTRCDIKWSLKVEAIQEQYAKVSEEDAERLGLPVECLGSCSFLDDPDTTGWQEPIEFSRYYNLDLLRARILKFFKGLEGKAIFQIEHANDPHYDSSGRILETSYVIDLNRFSSVGELCWLYNGNSEPSYESGCGLFHKTYADNLTEMVCEFVTNPFNVSNKHRFAEQYFSLDGIDDDKLCDFVEIVCDSSVELYLTEEFKKLSLG